MLWHMLTIFNFLRNCPVVFQSNCVILHFIFPIVINKYSNFPTFLAKLIIVLILIIAIPVVTQQYLTEVLIYISLTTIFMLRTFHVFPSHFCILFGEIIKDIFQSAHLFFVVELQEFFIYSGYEPLIRYMICQYFLLLHRLPFHSLIVMHRNFKF